MIPYAVLLKSTECPGFSYSLALFKGSVVKTNGMSLPLMLLLLCVALGNSAGRAAAVHVASKTHLLNWFLHP